MAGEKHGGAITAVVIVQERTHRLLGHDVEADGGLVEEEHARAVEQGGDELHLHAFTERKLADHDVHLFAHGEKVEQLVERRLILFGGQAVNVPEEEKGLDRGEIPPELVFLAEHQGEDAPVGVFPPRGVESGHARAARAGENEAGQHLQGGGLAGAIGSQESDELALTDGETDVVGRPGFLELAPEQAFHAAPKAGLLLVGAEHARQVLDLDHDGRESRRAPGTRWQTRKESAGPSRRL